MGPNRPSGRFYDRGGRGSLGGGRSSHDGLHAGGPRNSDPSISPRPPVGGSSSRAPMQNFRDPLTSSQHESSFTATPRGAPEQTSYRSMIEDRPSTTEGMSKAINRSVGSSVDSNYRNSSLPQEDNFGRRPPPTRSGDDSFGGGRRSPPLESDKYSRIQGSTEKDNFGRNLPPPPLSSSTSGGGDNAQRHPPIRGSDGNLPTQLNSDKDSHIDSRPPSGEESYSMLKRKREDIPVGRGMPMHDEKRPREDGRMQRPRQMDGPAVGGKQWSSSPPHHLSGSSTSHRSQSGMGGPPLDAQQNTGGGRGPMLSPNSARRIRPGGDSATFLSPFREKPQATPGSYSSMGISAPSQQTQQQQQSDSGSSAPPSNGPLGQKWSSGSGPSHSRGGIGSDYDSGKGGTFRDSSGPHGRDNDWVGEQSSGGFSSKKGPLSTGPPEDTNFVPGNRHRFTQSSSTNRTNGPHTYQGPQHHILDQNRHDRPTQGRHRFEPQANRGPAPYASEETIQANRETKTVNRTQGGALPEKSQEGSDRRPPEIRSTQKAAESPPTETKTSPPPASTVKESKPAEPPKRAPSPSPPAGPPSGLTVALTRLADLESQMEFEYAKHTQLLRQHDIIRAQIEVLETLPVGMEAFKEDLGLLIADSDFYEKD